MFKRPPLAVLVILALGAGCVTGPPRSMPATLGSASGRSIVRAALELEAATSPDRSIRRRLRDLSAEADGIRESLRRPRSAENRLLALNAYFFSPTGYAPVGGTAAPQNTSLAAALENRRGTCVGLAIVYLGLAQRLGLDAHAVATPVHLFIRVKYDGVVQNVELLEGSEAIDDFTYRRHYRIDDASIDSGAFMRDLTNDEVIAHLLSNQAVALSKQGRLDEAFARYDEALRRHPKLVAAWYNRGIDLMNAGRLKQALDSFDRAIALYPSDAQAHNNRGLTKAKLGNSDGARADFERALQLDPTMHEADENLKRLLGGSAP